MNASLLILAALILSPAAEARLRLSKVPASAANGLDFNPLNRADFNGDGVADLVSCTPTEVSILSGRDRKKIIYQWKSSEAPREDGAVFRVPKCEIVEISPGKPSLLQANLWEIPNQARWASSQFVFLNTGKGFRRLALPNPEGTAYSAVARSVSCTTYPESLVKKGYRPGALCFYAAYHDQNNATHTALVKIESNGSRLRTKDLTLSSGLPWSAGMAGTHASEFRVFEYGDGKKRHDGLRMRDSTFIDFNGDSLPDLITVGQHASMKAARMIADPRSAEGLSFDVRDITTAGVGEMSEYLRVIPLNQIENGANLPCLHVSGELLGQHFGGVPDHLRCYRKGQWSRVDFPSVFTSRHRGGLVRRDAKGRWLLRTFDFNYSGRVEPLVFQLSLDER